MRVFQSITLLALLTALLFAGVFPAKTKAEACCTEVKWESYDSNTWEIECNPQTHCKVWCTHYSITYHYDPYPPGCTYNWALIRYETWGCSDPHPNNCECDPYFKWSGDPEEYWDWCGPIPQ